jgi:DNA topoisomerase I
MKKYPIKRIRKKTKFDYIWKNGEKVSDKNEIERIKKLRIPPGYTHVEIYKPEAKIQATGLDDRKRTQYRYHEYWIRERNRKKFRDLIAFANNYPKISKTIHKTLNGKPKNKKEMTALAIGLLNICRLRPGSTKHLKSTGSFGTTTLLRGHIKEKKSKYLLIIFKGKSGVTNECKVRLNTKVGKSLSSLIKTKKNKLEPIFYIDNSHVTPKDINKFLQNIKTNKNNGKENKITAKAFRTYHANARFIQKMLPYFKIPIENATKRKQYATSTIKKIAEELHHTPATFCNSYLFPPLKTLFLENPDEFKKIFYKKNTDKSLMKFIKKNTDKSPKTPKHWL